MKRCGNGCDLTIFVYGTLQPGGRYWPEFCAGRLVDEPVPAKIRGALYDLHLGYPGLRLQGSDWVQGWVLRFTTTEDFLRLDQLEGYHPQGPDSENEYLRRKVAAFSMKGEPLGEVWAYEITEPVLTRCRGTRLPDGNWPLAQWSG